MFILCDADDYCKISIHSIEVVMVTCTLNVSYYLLCIDSQSPHLCTILLKYAVTQLLLCVVLMYSHHY